MELPEGQEKRRVWSISSAQQKPVRRKESVPFSKTKLDVNSVPHAHMNMQIVSHF